MIRLPLQHHRHRLPAIPPRIAPQTQTFSFDVHEARMGWIPNEWKTFLMYIGANSKLPFDEMCLRDAARFAKEMRGMDVRWVSGDFGNQIIITTSSPKPRISAKLLATFPWKLRKLLKP
jgi:hypothetical protein